VSRKSASIALCASLLATSGCASFGQTPSDVDRRLAALEREIAALRAAQAGGAATVVASAQVAPGAGAQAAPGGAAPAAPPDTPVAKPAGEPLSPWHVTPDITFKPGLRVQTRYSHDGGPDNNDIAIQRFRLKASGDAWKAKYGVEMKIDGTGRTGANPNAAVENAWLDYAFAPDYLVGRAGLYDLPFSRDALTSDSKLLFMDRSLIKDALTFFGLADNGIGVMARGRPLGGHLEYAAGVFNNESFDGPGVFRSRGSTNDVMPVGRIAVDLLDRAPAGGYADYKASYVGEGRRLAIGLDGARLGNAENNVNGVVQEFDLSAWGTDLFFNWGPYTLQAEYNWFRVSGDVDGSNRGWYVQGGYLVEPLNAVLAEAAPWFPDLELAARYQQLDAESFSPDEEKRTSLGMNAYIHGHNLKIQTDLSFRQLQQSADSKLYQIQLQLDF
jgi:phosphate-selective porin